MEFFEPRLANYGTKRLERGGAEGQAAAVPSNLDWVAVVRSVISGSYHTAPMETPKCLPETPPLREELSNLLHIAVGQESVTVDVEESEIERAQSDQEDPQVEEVAKETMNQEDAEKIEPKRDFRAGRE